MAQSDIALLMQKVSKRFPGTLAVDSVDFEVRAGEVHALMGENGAGKSTLMKILAGSFDDYTGDISIDGKPVQLHSPLDARNAGVGMMYQELSVAFNRSVMENLYAGNIPGGVFYDKKKLYNNAIKSLARVGLDKKIDPKTLMKNIPQHESQLIELAKVLNSNPKILVMDEPTSALSSEEVTLLFDIIKDLKNEGMAVVYISHHLPEIFEVADRVTIMRDGQKVGTHHICDVSKEDVVEMMIGRKVDNYQHAGSAGNDEVIMKVEHLTHYGYVHDISFELKKGEILGVVGLAGSGRTELGRVLCGADKMDDGTITLDGKAIKPGNMSHMMNEGIAYLTEDRKTEGLALRLTNRDNIFSTIIPRLSKVGLFIPNTGKSLLQEQYERLQIYPPDPTVNTSNLSGGNQQKILLAKWLTTKPKVLILDEPSRGVDVGAKKLIHETVVKLAEEGISIIVLSSDLPELVSLSDRVIVMKAGHLIGEVHRDESFDESRILLAANGEGSALSVNY